MGYRQSVFQSSVFSDVIHFPKGRVPDKPEGTGTDIKEGGVESRLGGQTFLVHLPMFCKDSERREQWQGRNAVFCFGLFGLSPVAFPFMKKVERSGVPVGFCRKKDSSECQRCSRKQTFFRRPVSLKIKRTPRFQPMAGSGECVCYSPSCMEVGRSRHSRLYMSGRRGF